MWQTLGAPADCALGLVFSEAAEREARRILSETERGLAFQIGEQYPNTCPVSEYGEALAEALATFINASIE
jgi:hypothetical protein